MNSLHTNRNTPVAPVTVPGYLHIPGRVVNCALNKSSPRWLTRSSVTHQLILTLQKNNFQDQSSLCICDSFHAAQRYACEILETTTFANTHTYVIHEMMPHYQQEYIVSCLNASHHYHLNSPIALFTSANYYTTLIGRLPWLKDHYQHIKTAQNQSVDIIENSMMIQPTVSCICLRTGPSGHWILMDHEEANTVSPHFAPSDNITDRLLNHTINITGNRLAPYLAMMFDVPQAWKTDPRLVTQSLLIFDRDVCATGCTQPGIPRRLIWSDVFGIVYDF